MRVGRHESDPKSLDDSRGQPHIMRSPLRRGPVSIQRRGGGAPLAAPHRPSVTLYFSWCQLVPLRLATGAESGSVGQRTTRIDVVIVSMWHAGASPCFGFGRIKSEYRQVPPAPTSAGDVAGSPAGFVLRTSARLRAEMRCTSLKARRAWLDLLGVERFRKPSWLSRRRPVSLRLRSVAIAMAH